MDWNPQGTRKRQWQAQNYMAQKHTEGPEGDQHDLVRSQKNGSGPTEMESNCGRLMFPMGQRGLDDDEFLVHFQSLFPLFKVTFFITTSS